MKAKGFWRSGEPFIWLTGSALDAALLMVAGLIVLIIYNGMGFFWPRELERFTLEDGREVLGQVVEREPVPDPGAPRGTPPRYRLQVKQANRDLLGIDFLWIEESAIRKRLAPPEAVVIERLEWGNLHGEVLALKEGDTVVAEGPAAFRALQERMPRIEDLRSTVRSLRRHELGAISAEQERIRLHLRSLGLEEAPPGDSGPGPHEKEAEGLERQLASLDREYRAVEARAASLRASLQGTLVVSACGGASGAAQEKEVPLAEVVRAYQPNRMGLGQKVGFYLSKVWEFISDDPRESNTEGGVFPAIFGTVFMVLLMSLVVTPLGVLAAFYLREYAKQGPLVSAVRIAVNNLAGVPSIVFGVFGVAFFIYFLGGSIDRLFYPETLPAPTFGTGGLLWASLTLALLTVPVVIVATEEGLAAIPRGMREASLALGATRFETTWRVVLPAVMPSILTGLILAMARAAGEVAPLMLTGVVKLAPTLPVDGTLPLVHLERKFMHLGFHIYDVGFQSPNVDAARPMVYTTTLLLVLIVLALNLTAISLRTRLRRKYSLAAL